MRNLVQPPARKKKRSSHSRNVMLQRWTVGRRRGWPGLSLVSGILAGLALLACSSGATSTGQKSEATVAPTVVPAPTLAPVSALITPLPATATPTPVKLPPSAPCGPLGLVCPGEYQCTPQGYCLKPDPAGDLVFVPRSKAGIGCNVAQKLPCSSEELPWHTVTLSDFGIDRTEVTVRAYRKCVDAGQCTTPHSMSHAGRCTWVDRGSSWKPGTGSSSAGGPDSREDLPINCVTWYQASDYCLFVGRELPTEAQWERAARGPEGRRQPWGDDVLSCERANVFLPPKFCVGDPVKPGSYPAGTGPYGAVDQIGNLLEWTRDWYDAKYYYDSADTDPLGPPQTGRKSLRGSSFSDAIRGGQYVSARYFREPDTASAVIGFRCARPGG